MELQGKKVSVIGLARSGLATANFLAARGARVVAVDRKPRSALGETLARLHPAVQTRFESSVPEPDAELVVLSPGVDIDSPDLAPARERRAEIIGEIELAARFNRAPVIAVTGTNGKTTTTTLIGKILENAGKTVRVGGNIGVPFISLVDDTPKDYMVLEISSFQMETSGGFRPRIAVILNLTPDHLDRHKTLERYAALKRNIAANQTRDDHLILNWDDPLVRAMGEGIAAEKLYFSLHRETENGAFLRHGKLVLRHDQVEHTLCNTGELTQVMQWQLENALASAVATFLAGADPATIAKTLAGFSGLEHRLEWVRTLDGVDYVNDSKSTNVGSLLKCLNSFARPVILIAGGQDKGLDFSPLRDPLKKLKRLVLIGEARNKFKQILNGGLPFEEAESLENAVRQAHQTARPGDIVLLSPGCASFDMFKNYEDRGRQFKEIVGKL
jgi:UDP-N-acetylmuramoylalanine--D-glutamate ligase